MWKGMCVLGGGGGGGGGGGQAIIRGSHEVHCYRSSDKDIDFNGDGLF